MQGQAEREAAAIALLDRFPWSNGGCLIGGYAIAAYGKPRFSQDLDLVVPEAERAPVVKALENLGFRLRPERRAKTTFTQAATLLKGDFSIDLMFGLVRDRETGATLPEAWVSARSRLVRLDLLTGATKGKVQVARPEALWALKLIAARDQDLSDLFAISGEPIEIPEIQRALSESMTPGLRRKLDLIPTRLEGSKIYSDALSSRSMGRQDSPRNIQSWTRFVKLVDSVLPS